MVATAENAILAGVEDGSLTRVADKASSASVKLGMEELKELRASVSKNLTEGLEAFMKFAAGLLPDFENICAGDSPDKEAMAKLGTERTTDLLPSLAAKCITFVEVAETCGVARTVTSEARALHKRLRVYIAVAHVTDRLYGQTAKKAQPDRAALRRELSSQGLQNDIPAFLHKELSRA